MSNPGWFPQPDGRERYFDGNDWTDNFRAPQAPVANYGATAAPQKSGGALKWVLITLGVIALCCGGGFVACSAGIVGAADEVSKSIESEASEEGGTENAKTIVEGKAFSVRDFNYAAGWAVSEDALGNAEVEDLKVTNNRDKRDSALVDIKFMKGDEILANVSCTSDMLNIGQTTTLNCFGADPMPDDYDRITINDTF